jgi:hypothetical protein
MHVLQWIAVKSEEDFEEAAGLVEEFLDEELNPGSSWFDWFVIGGGRFNPEQDSYNTSYNMVIDLEEHGLSAIQEKVDWAITARMNEFGMYRKQFEASNVNVDKKLDSYAGITQYDFDLYGMKKMIDMLQGNWDFNSYFYDMEHYSTNPKFMLDKLASGDVNWYLVPVDFHF